VSLLAPFVWFKRETLSRTSDNPYKEIASQLGISVETVRTHIHNTYEKLHVRTRTEAVMKVFGRSPSP
jgi:DNA-binding CsgD family transcriptional regulator